MPNIDRNAHNQLALAALATAGKYIDRAYGENEYHEFDLAYEAILRGLRSVAYDLENIDTLAHTLSDAATTVDVLAFEDTKDDASLSPYPWACTDDDAEGYCLPTVSNPPRNAWGSMLTRTDIDGYVRETPRAARENDGRTAGGR